GAGKKAFWYESGNKHKGILYDSIPGLIVHGYDELEKMTNRLLNDVSDSQYCEYTQRHIKNRVEGHFDGSALTRFRNLLATGE
ncbi:MAG: hypothetical protein NTY14_09015, partial [Candidatus Omnitrophica bacterium]|nr:hypothetical protein [Candidatus Omnitrophota bacterium]